MWRWRTVNVCPTSMSGGWRAVSSVRQWFWYESRDDTSNRRLLFGTRWIGSRTVLEPRQCPRRLPPLLTLSKTKAHATVQD